MIFTYDNIVMYGDLIQRLLDSVLYGDKIERKVTSIKDIHGGLHMSYYVAVIIYEIANVRHEYYINYEEVENFIRIIRNEKINKILL